MRPVIVACAVVAGTAIQFLFSRRAHRQQPPEDPADNDRPSTDPPTTPSSPSNQNPPPPTHNATERPRSQPSRSQPSRSRFRPKPHRNPFVLQNLNSISPVIPGTAFVAKYGHDRDCTFCLDPITARSPRIRVTPCGHGFHAQCLEEWVQYTAAAAFDWRNYTVTNEGVVDFTKSAPTCPNCTCRLPVLPPKVVHTTILNAVSRALSLPDLEIVNHVFNIGIITPSENVDYLSHPELDPRSQSFPWARALISSNLDAQYHNHTTRSFTHVFSPMFTHNHLRERAQSQVNQQIEEQAYFNAQIESQMRPVASVVSANSSPSSYFLSANPQSTLRHSRATDTTQHPSEMASQETHYGGRSNQSSVAHVPPPSPRMLERNAGRRADGSSYSSQSRSTIVVNF